MSDIADSLGKAAIGAIVAAVGYVARLFVESWRDYRQTRNARLAALLQLRTLLRASRVSFEIQNDHAIHLHKMIIKRDPALRREGYEETLAEAYPSMPKEERELHSLIRGITVTALKPTNEQILDWTQKDTWFKGQHSKRSLRGDLAEKLSQLEAHLLLWRAKYEAWIPGNPEHALIYLNDEKAHGLGFPSGLDAAVQTMLINRDVSG